MLRPWRRSHKVLGGFTLLELVIALALWLILSTGVFLVMQHTVLSGTQMLERQNAFENARISMDALVMNFQMARHVTLTTSGDNFQSTILNQRRRIGPGLTYEWHNYRIRHQQALNWIQIGQPGNWNEFSDGIGEVRIVYVENSLQITVVTDCESEPITMQGSVCVRYKCLRINGAVIRSCSNCGF